MGILRSGKSGINKNDYVQGGVHATLHVEVRSTVSVIISPLSLMTLMLMGMVLYDKLIKVTNQG